MPEDKVNKNVSGTFEGLPFPVLPDGAPTHAAFLRSLANDIRAENWALIDDEEADLLEKVAAWTEGRS